MARGNALKNLAIFHSETWEAQCVQQSSPFKSSLSVRDKHAAALRDDSEMYYALTRERRSWPKADVLFYPFRNRFPSLLYMLWTITILWSTLKHEETTAENKKRTCKIKRAFGHTQLP